ncbi:hypothetical protein ACGFJ5_29815 [Micromonospora echinaurantiaca]|uniref:hypothetical protein n=1 Tax=Micromonospora echinaurantiaca TaxID=47857 RepID=UPI00371A8502
MSDHGTEESSSMSADEQPSTSRRRIIKAGVVAGAGAGVGAVAAAAPASADPGDPVVLGALNNAQSSETVLVGGSSANPTLALRGAPGQAPLRFSPEPDNLLPTEMPTGSLAVTTEGNLVIGGRSNTKAYVNTSRWANRTVAIPPTRILDTRSVPTSTTYDKYIVGGRANVDSSGRLKAKTAIQLTISGLPDVTPGQAQAAYVNITVAGTVAAGFLTAYSAQLPRPGTSSLNWWGPNQILSNLVEVQVGTYSNRPYTFTIYTDSTTSVIVDVSGLILANPAS